MKKIISLFIVGMLAGSTSIAFAASPKLSLSSPETSTYQCNDGSKVKATYYNLSDNSLSFVKLTLDGEVYTLPQMVSASGVRYTDEHKIEWFTKGDTALLNKDVNNKKSVDIECKKMAS